MGRKVYKQTVILNNKNDFNEDTAFDIAADIAARIHEAAVEECEEYYNGEDLDDCRQDPDYDYDAIKVVLACDGLMKEEEFEFDIYSAVNEARVKGLI